MATAQDGSGPVVSSGVSLHQFLQHIRAQGTSPEWQGHCPGHDDKQASMHVTLAADGKVLVKCHAACDNQDLLIEKLRQKGLWPIKVSTEQARLAATTVAAAAREREFENLTATDEKPPRPSTPEGFQFVKIHEYRARQGHLLGTVTRFEEIRPNGALGKPAKKFIPTFYFMKDGLAQWLHKGIALRQFYNLPSLNKEGPVIIVEGEKTCDAGIPHFPNQPLISPMGGLQGFNRTDFLPLRGRDVVIWPDADANWKENAESWARSLSPIVNSIKIVHLPRMIVEGYPKWDLADPLPEYLSLVRRLYAEARPFMGVANVAFTCITKAEDLREFYVKVFIQHSVNYVHFTTGRSLSQSQYDDHFRRFTKSRFGLLPSQYLIEGPNSEARIFDEFAYEPDQPRLYFSKEHGRHSYNRWTPGKLEPREGDVSPFLEHLEWLLNPEDRLEFIRRLANLVQNPRNRPTSVFLIQGKQGVGKSLIFNNFGSIVGFNNYCVVEPDIILSGYNSLFACKTLLVLNEFTDFNKHEFLDHVKGFIADPTTTVSEKYVPSYQVSNHTHIFALTNQERPVHLVADDRRFYIARCVPVAPKPINYYVYLADWFEKNMDVLFWYLKNYTIGDWNAKAIPPMTLAKTSVIQRSHNRWLVEIEVLIKEGELKYNIFKESEFFKVLKANGIIVPRHEEVMEHLRATFGSQVFPYLEYPYHYRGVTLFKKANFVVLQPNLYSESPLDVIDLYNKERKHSEPESDLI